MTLEPLKTYATRYPSNSGERVVLPQAIYDQIIALAEKGERLEGHCPHDKWLELAGRCEQRAQEWDNSCGSGCDARSIAAAVLRCLADDLRKCK